MNLGLNNNPNIAQLTGDLLCLVQCGRDSAARRRHIEFLQQLFGLMFVNVHDKERRSPVRRFWIFRESGIARATRLSNDYSFSNWLAAEIEPSTLAAMRNPMRLFSLAGTLLLSVALSLVAGTREQEKAFTDKYKAAMEGKDTATLESFLYTQGSDPAAVEFYKMMQSGEAGEKISSIELVNLTPEDVKKATTPMDGPTGKVCLTLKPTKKLVVKVEKKDANGSSSSSSENFVAEKDGKFVIPVPGPCK